MTKASCRTRHYRCLQGRQTSLKSSVDSLVKLSTFFRCGMGQPNGQTHQRKNDDDFVHQISCFRFRQANPLQRSHRHFHHDSMSKLTCMVCRSLKIGAQSDLLLRQQPQNFPAPCSAGPLVREHAIKGDILPGEKSVQTHFVHSNLVRHFPVSHCAFRPIFGRSRPPTLSTGRNEVTCVNGA